MAFLTLFQKSVTFDITYIKNRQKPKDLYTSYDY